MKNTFVIRICLFLLALYFLAPLSASATPAMTPVPMPEKINPILPIAEEIGAQLQSLVTPAPPPADPNASGDEANIEPLPTYGTRVLNVIINITQILRDQALHFVNQFDALPQIGDWFLQQQNDPKLSARWVAIGNDILSTAGIAILAALAVELVFFPLRSMLRQRTPQRISGRIAVVSGLFLLRAIPILVFVATAVVLLNQYETQKLQRYLIMNMVYALALARTTISFLRGVFSPNVDRLRFVPATTAQALYGYRWLRAFGLLIIFGYFLLIVARAVRVPEDAVMALVNLFGLVLVTMGIIVILQKRSFVAHLLRGNLSAAQRHLTWFDSLRLWFARQWHKLSIAYLVFGYAIAVLGAQDGLLLLLRGTILTLLTLFVARLLFLVIGKRETKSSKDSTTLYSLIKGVSLRMIVVFSAIAGILASWGADLAALTQSPLGQRLLGSAFSIGSTLFVLGLIYEFFSTMVDRHLSTTDEDGKLMEPNARSRTLLPMLRNALFISLMGIVGVVVLSEAGINIGPLLAGAGVVGVAVGFGSQTLVKDFLTGLFIVLENTIAVGDVVKVGDHSGTVEAMSMRTLRLRDQDGALHILPFSEVSQIINQTRGFSHAVIKISVAHTTDLNKAMACFEKAGADLQNDPIVKNKMLDTVEVLGVDSINDMSITLMARIRTKPGDQWSVKRMFLMHLKQRFDQEGIDLPGATTVVVQKI